MELHAFSEYRVGLKNGQKELGYSLKPRAVYWFKDRIGAYADVRYSAYSTADFAKGQWLVSTGAVFLFPCVG